MFWFHQKLKIKNREKKSLKSNQIVTKFSKIKKLNINQFILEQIQSDEASGDILKD